MPRTNANQSGRFFFLLLALATVSVVLVARPIANALFLAAALAGVLWGWHQRLSRALWKRRGLSAATFVIAVVLLLIAPLAAFLAFAINEGGEGLAYVNDIARSHDLLSLVDRLPRPLSRVAHHFIDQFSAKGGPQDLLKMGQQHFGSFGAKAAATVGATLSATGDFLFQTAMMLIAFYFFLLQGDQLVRWLDELSPLKPGQTRALMLEVKEVAYAVVLSTLITSAVQAAAALMGYFIARVPHPVFFAGVTFFAAFIPAIGAGSVCLIAALLMFVTGHPYAALFLALWGLIVVSLIDNLVKPLLIKAGMQMNGAVVFFALIGGLGAFGAVGLLLGPLFVAFFLALLRMYQRDFRSEANARITQG